MPGKPAGRLLARQSKSFAVTAAVLNLFSVHQSLSDVLAYWPLSAAGACGNTAGDKEGWRSSLVSS